MNPREANSDITVSFTCSSNTALLLITLHDLLTISVDDSIAVMSNFSWLVDEIAQRIESILIVLGEDSTEISELVRHLAQYVRRRSAETTKMADTP